MIMIEPKDILGIVFVAALLFFIAKGMVKLIAKRKEKKQMSESAYLAELKKEVAIQEQSKVEPEIDHFSSYYEQIFKDQQFINKETNSLDGFIINTELNHYDLHKLAQLNGIKIEMHSGWNDLALELMRELDQKGWNRKVSSIKEKFGELRFYADSNEETLLDEFTDRSKSICEICGAPGEWHSTNTWDFTRCEEHLNH
ncbi:MAG: hypothetical protein ACPGED_08685 [Flavobacteriales bacterium]